MVQSLHQKNVLVFVMEIRIIIPSLTKKIVVISSTVYLIYISFSEKVKKIA